MNVIEFEWCCLIVEFNGSEDMHHIDTSYEEWVNDRTIEHDNNNDSIVDENDYAIYLETV